MADIIRSIKRGNVRTFDESYNKGFKSVQANEVDADFNILYDAWNFGTINFADSSVTSQKLADGSVTSSKLAPDSVSSSNIINGAVTAVDLEPTVASRLSPTFSASDANKVLAVNVAGSALYWIAAPPATLAPGQVTTASLADAPNGVTDEKITSVSWAKITGTPTSMPPSGPAGGTLAGSYPNPTLAPGTSALPTGPAGGDLAGSYPNPTIPKLIARVTRNNATGLSVPHNTAVYVDWDTVAADTGGFWSAGNPTLFTIPSAGLYLIGATGQLGGGTLTNGYRQLRIEETATGNIVADFTTPNGAWNGTTWAVQGGGLTINAIYYCTAGLTVRVKVVQSSGVTCNLLPGAVTRPAFWIMKLT